MRPLTTLPEFIRFPCDPILTLFKVRPKEKFILAIFGQNNVKTGIILILDIASIGP